MPTVEVLKIHKWDSLHFMYKVKLATLVYKIYYDLQSFLNETYFNKEDFFNVSLTN